MHKSTTCPFAECGLRATGGARFRRAGGHAGGGCPVAERFRALALRTRVCSRLQPPPVTADLLTTSPGSAVPPGRTDRLRNALLKAARSFWPTPLAVIRSGVVRLPPRGHRRAAVPVLRVVSVVGLSGLVVSAELAGRVPIRAAFAEVAGAFDRTQAGAADASAGDVERGGSVQRLGPTIATASGASVRPTSPRRAAAPRRLLVPVGLPVRGPVSSPFGVRVHPVTGRVRLHRGVDLAVPVGTLVVATAHGRVLSVGRRNEYGLTVEVGHRSRRSRLSSTLYAHLSAVSSSIRAGAVVRLGSVIGFSGGVGAGAGLSTGPHVHYEVRAQGVAVDPVVVAWTAGARWSARRRGTARRRFAGVRSGVASRDRRRPVGRGVP